MAWHIAAAAGVGLLMIALTFIVSMSVGKPPRNVLPPDLNVTEEMAKELFDVKLLDFDQGVIVHLFEWPWPDIAKECETFLAPKGFAAVQISPPTEHIVVEGGPWYQRYQIVSYLLESRSGTRAELEDMVKRCNAVGVKVFAEVVINHMTGDGECKGVAGTPCTPEERRYDLGNGKKYEEEDFHQQCDITDPYNVTEVRVCELFKLHDLDQGNVNVRMKITDMMNDLIGIGVAGFRINAAMNIFPEHLFQIYSALDHLNPAHGFAKHTRPFIYQDVEDLDRGAVKYTEYTSEGLITDARYSRKLNELIKHRRPSLSKLNDFGSEWLAPSHQSIVYVDDFNSERQTGNFHLNFRQSRVYKMAVAFMLAWGHGTPVVHSSYKFNKPSDGPPVDAQGKVVSPNPNEDNICDSRWVCQHRWRQIYNMVAFHEATKGQKMTGWWINDKGMMIHFNMGKVGAIGFNFEGYAFSTTVKTGMPAGEYCDIISGMYLNGACTGRTVEVMDSPDGDAHIHIEKFNENDHNSDGVWAIVDHKVVKHPYSGPSYDVCWTGKGLVSWNEEISRKPTG